MTRIRWSEVALPLLALALRLASAPTTEFGYVVLAIHALFGPAQAVQALGMAWLFAMLSHGIGPEVSSSSFGFYVVLASAALSAFLRRSGPRSAGTSSAPIVATLMLGFFIVTHSALFSRVPEVSLLKGIAWTLTMTTLLAAWGGLSDSAHARLETQVFGSLILIAAVSLPLLASTVGYLNNGTGFQGILNHPQSFGPTMALLASWLMGRMLSSRNIRWPQIGLVGVVLALLMASEARTAGLGILLGLVIALPLSIVFSGAPVRSLLPGIFHGRLHFLAMLIVLSGLLAGTGLTTRLQDFIQKRDEASSILDVYELSRGALIDAMLDNFDQFPFQGIGFGAPSNEQMLQLERDPVFDLPVSSSIEKGVVPLQVLEELGIPGAVAVAAWLLVILRHVLRGGFVPTAVCMTALVVNMGEAVLFSPRGAGLLFVILLSWAATSRGMFPLKNRASG